MLNLLTPMPATPDISRLTVKQPTLEQLSTNKDVLYPGQRKISGQRANGLAELIAQQDPELENIPSPNNVSEYKESLSQAKANIELSINFINDSKIENNENVGPMGPHWAPPNPPGPMYENFVFLLLFYEINYSIVCFNVSSCYSFR